MQVVLLGMVPSCLRDQAFWNSEIQNSTVCSVLPRVLSSLLVNRCDVLCSCVRSCWRSVDSILPWNSSLLLHLFDSVHGGSIEDALYFPLLLTCSAVSCFQCSSAATLCTVWFLHGSTFLWTSKLLADSGWNSYTLSMERFHFGNSFRVFVQYC